MSYCLTCAGDKSKTAGVTGGKLTFKCVSRDQFTNERGWTFGDSCVGVSALCEGHGCLEQLTAQIYRWRDGADSMCVSRQTCEAKKFAFVDDVEHYCTGTCDQSRYGLKYEEEKAYHCVADCSATGGKYEVYEQEKEIYTDLGGTGTITKQCVNCTGGSQYVHGNVCNEISCPKYVVVDQSKVCVDKCSDDARYKFFDGQKCVDKCESGMFEDADDYVCKTACLAVLGVPVHGMWQCVPSCKAPNKYRDFSDQLGSSVMVCASVCSSGYYYKNKDGVLTCLKTSSGCPPQDDSSKKYAYLVDIMYECISSCVDGWFINGNQCVHTCPSYVIVNSVKTCQECAQYWQYDDQQRKRCVSVCGTDDTYEYSYGK